MRPDEYCAIAHIDISPRAPNGIENCEMRLQELVAQDSPTPGVVDLVALQQSSRSNHFELVGRYRSEEAYLEHLVAPSKRAFRAGITSALAAPYWDRLHRARGEQPWPRGGVGDFVAITQLEVLPQRLEASRHVLDELADAQRGSRGLIGQVFLQRPVPDNNLELLSVWSSPEAFEEQLESTLVDSTRRALAPLLVAPIEDRRHHVLCGAWSVP